ncbi:uncharacterized protein LOC127796752 [Diospyros lotus]|uniref:uncharacterized protein LOC127796752 n=1 Tax=Diospyros lotus TaxID=55363 RepID=UPI002254F812|nr:uncharacterized protein LOC127796752 [Diospyros lotus]XP_052185075.1 uncharacterized protein LOC127796752 [Diospyros lotus]XP_052185076.1 uncharacterized protein LOC127796752 [Diospyros lotus]XP_052185078.1 uncharacterized protein LOC127796752 [Diospyros lotus]
MASRKRSKSNETDIKALHKEWDEALCPICMDHPHNAVLLLCSSYEKGCRSYICDTSYRHSNCLDRFKILREDNKSSLPLPTSLRGQQETSTRNLVLRITDATEPDRNDIINESNNVPSIELTGGSGGADPTLADLQLGRNLEVQGEGISYAGDSETLWERTNLEASRGENSSEIKLDLKCPLCRGTVMGWKVVDETRKYLDLKPRNCSHESCSFFGSYRELRRHARRVHPTVRPSDVDPSRQRAWRRLERQREYADIVSSIRAAMPGAIVLGDYVIENGDRVIVERDRASSEVNGPWWTSFFLFQMIDSMDAVSEPRGGRSRAWSRHRRSTGTSARRRYLWGENLLGLQDDEDDESLVNVLSDTGEDGSLIPRRRRRLTHSGSDEDQ